MAKNNVRYLYA